jgi:hypothetical protein
MALFWAIWVTCTTVRPRWGTLKDQRKQFISRMAWLPRRFGIHHVLWFLGSSANPEIAYCSCTRRVANDALIYTNFDSHGHWALERASSSIVFEHLHRNPKKWASLYGNNVDSFAFLNCPRFSGRPECHHTWGWLVQVLINLMSKPVRLSACYGFFKHYIVSIIVLGRM